jgi:riboflavin kinase/FMN adenylyltransferase
VASVGVRPTFDNGERLLEVYLLDCFADLYGAQMTVEFVAHLRPELRFESVDDLVIQMGVDVTDARKALARAGL